MSRRADQAAATLAQPVAGVSQEAVIWALRLMIGREPVDAAEVALHQQHSTLENLRHAFAGTWEFERLFHAARASAADYALPLFLLRPPANPAIPFRFEPPSLEAPASQAGTARQCAEPVFEEMCAALGLKPAPRRGHWEQAWMLNHAALAGLVARGRRALGLGLTRERLPSALAHHGVQVLATDLPARIGEGQDADAWHQRALQLFHPEAVSLETFEARIDFRPLDPAEPPRDTAGTFDLCFSARLASRLGSIAAGVAMIEASLAFLKPGGLALHTLELNLGSDETTLETPDLTLLRRSDVEELTRRLVLAGHAVMPLNFHPGDAPEDAQIAMAPLAPVQLKLKVGPWPHAVFGLAIRRRA